MNKIVFAFIGLMLISIIPQSFAQSPIGNYAYQERTDVIISEDGDIHVVHEIKKDSRSARSFTMIEGIYSNLIVIDVNGKEIQYAFLEEERILTIFPSDENVLIEYDLEDVLVQENGVLSWDFLYADSGTTRFLFPDNIELVFVEERPVYIKEIKNVKCHGCQMFFEFVLNQNKILKEITWEDKKFDVEIRTLSNIESFNFDQPSRSINLETDGDNQIITLIIPLELLWNPYQVMEGNEKIIKKYEFQIDETHVGLNFRSESSGDIQIIGTSVVPEFPLFAPLVVGTVLVVALQFRSKINLH